MKKKGRIKQTAIKAEPLFTLPADLNSVKLLGLTQGLANATIAWSEKPTRRDDLYIRAAAVESAIRVERDVVAQGRRGANDPVLFRQTYSDICAQSHVLVEEVFERNPAIHRDLARAQHETNDAMAMLEVFQQLAPEALSRFDFLQGEEQSH